MKKLQYILPAMLLFAAGACSSDEPAPIVPDEPITLQPATVDQPDVTAPSQLFTTADEATAAGFEWSSDAVSGVEMRYDNGQIITYTISASTTTTGETRFLASVRIIAGTAKDVVIPAKLQWTYNYEPQVFDVTGLQLAVTDKGDFPVADGIESITVPVGCNPVSVFDTPAIGQMFSRLLACGKDVKNIYLESGYSKFCSIDGCVYSDDHKTLVAVPSAREGQFTAAEGTETVAAYAFCKCDKLDVITLPKSIKAIEENAMIWTKDLLVVNILADKAPSAAQNAFGHYAKNCVVRVPEGTTDGYKQVELVEPIAPVMPADPGPEATDEEIDAYIEAIDKYYEEEGKYQDEMVVYEKELAKNLSVAGYQTVKKVEGWNFTIL